MAFNHLVDVEHWGDSVEVDFNAVTGEFLIDVREGDRSALVCLPKVLVEYLAKELERGVNICNRLGSHETDI